MEQKKIRNNLDKVDDFRMTIYVKNKANYYNMRTKPQVNQSLNVFPFLSVLNCSLENQLQKYQNS